jgi:CHAT domain-containing protein
MERYQSGDYAAAIALWQNALQQYERDRDHPSEAIVVENLALAYQQVGQSERAIIYWQRAVKLARQIGTLAQVGRLLTAQAQTHSWLGQLRPAIALLCTADGLAQTNSSPFNPEHCAAGSAVQIARSTEDVALEAAALGSLGDVYRLSGNYATAIAALESGLKLAPTIDQPAYQSAMLTSLGNVYSSRAQRRYRRAESATLRGAQTEATELQQTARQDDAAALSYLQQSFQLAQSRADRLAQVRSRLSALPLYYRQSAFSEAQAAVTQIRGLLTQLPDSRDRVYAAIDLARLGYPAAGTTASLRCSSSLQSPEAAGLLREAVAVAERLQDARARSFAYGSLGHREECRGDYATAFALTQQARLAANQDLAANDSLYLWEWQTARILNAQGKPGEAIAVYEQAIASLEAIRGDILTANRDLQFDFRDTVEPVYRELVALRLSLEPSPNVATKSEPRSLPDRERNLSMILSTLDALKLAELQNYFGDDCVITAINQPGAAVKLADNTTAILSSIILGDRTAVILSLPNQEQRVAWIPIDNQRLRQEVIQFRRGLESFFDPFNPAIAQQLYDWLIRPFATDLTQAQIKTLVFVQDGILRSVPMAALHDGQQFLIQRYAVATTPSLALTDFRPLQPKNLRVLALGLTQSATIGGRQFPALDNVSAEIQAVTREIPGSKPLIDQDFTRDRMRQELSTERYPLIHIATHGEFASDPEDTFLITGDRQRLTITELEALIRQVARGQDAIDLLTLTACQTAVGDDRAALGLAGVAVQAGARSALASLWFINDAATADLAAQFYANLGEPNTNRAIALQRAQQSLIEAGGVYAHPAYWAPFVLVGNWL